MRQLGLAGNPLEVSAPVVILPTGSSRADGETGRLQPCQHAGFDRESIPYEAAFLAGKCFPAYRRRGGTKQSPLPDLFIGAHAAIAGYRLITRDARLYRTYFPRLPLIAPD
jgi:predicted nucleic acid-binding protein